MSQSSEPLNEFGTAEFEQWRKWVERSVPSFDDLTRLNRAGLPVLPLYCAEHLPEHGAHRHVPGEPPFLRGTGPSPWRIEGEYSAADPDRVAASIAEDLARGLQAPWVRLDPAIRRGGPLQETLDVREIGTMVATLPALRSLVGSLDLARMPLFVEAGVAAFPLIVALATIADERGMDPARLRGGMLSDPLSILAEFGGLAVPLEQGFARLADAVAWGREHVPEMALVEVSTVPWHDAGATAPEEVAIALATGVEYLRVLDRYGLDLPVIVPRMVFRFAVGNDPFVEMAKLRAARLLWSGIIESAGGGRDHRLMRLLVRTSDRTGSAIEPWNDLVRGTVQTFAAACSGVEGISTRSFDRAQGEPGDLGRRLALNTQLILREESHLDRVSDPGGGSFYLEAMTDALARSAWQLVQEIEGNGGMIASLRDGTLQERLGARGIVTAQEVRAGTRPIIGVNRYPATTKGATEATSVDRRTETMVAAERRRSETVQRDLEQRLDAVKQSVEGAALQRAQAVAHAMLGGADAADVLDAMVDGGARIFVPPLTRQRDAEATENDMERAPS